MTLATLFKDIAIATEQINILTEQIEKLEFLFLSEKKNKREKTSKNRINLKTEDCVFQLLWQYNTDELVKKKPIKADEER